LILIKNQVLLKLFFKGLYKFNFEATIPIHFFHVAMVHLIFKIKVIFNMETLKIYVNAMFDLGMFITLD
jgi:hypothetical protein